jgi:hypothetical protein
MKIFVIILRGKFKRQVFSIVKPTRISYMETKTLMHHFKEYARKAAKLSDFAFVLFFWYTRHVGRGLITS